MTDKLSMYVLGILFMIMNFIMIFYSPISNKYTSILFFIFYIIFPAFLFLLHHKDILGFFKKDYYDYAVVLSVFGVALFFSNMLVELYFLDLNKNSSKNILNLLVFIYIFIVFILIRKKTVLMLNVAALSFVYYYGFIYIQKDENIFIFFLNLFNVIIPWYFLRSFIRFLIKLDFDIKNKDNNNKIKKIKLKNNFVLSFFLSLFFVLSFLNIKLYLKDYVNFNFIYENSYCDGIDSNVKILNYKDSFYIDKKQFLYYDTKYSSLKNDKYYKNILEIKENLNKKNKSELFFDRMNLAFGQDFPSAFRFKKIECKY